jgi:hypothetical protein
MTAPNALQNHVTAIIGMALCTQFLAIAMVAREHGIPMITNISANVQATGIGDCISGFVPMIDFGDPVKDVVIM